MSNFNIPVVFLGIDVHKRTYSVTAVANKTIIKRATMQADPQILLAFIQKHFTGACVHSVYEAGFSGYFLHRFLTANGILNTVVHPASIEIAVNNKNKNDKRDSEKMGFQLSEGKLQCVNIPTPQREAWRGISRLRSQFVKERTRTASKLKGFLYYHNLMPYNNSKRTSRTWVRKQFELKTHPDIAFCIRHYAETWLYFDFKIKMIDKKLKEQAKEDFRINEVYRRHAGIGFIIARILANELGDLSQFSSARKLYGYIGLTPCEYSSGDKRRYGNISRHGNPIIRSILTEAAWKAIKKDSQLTALFDRLVKNTSSRRKAILGVARTMLGQIRAEFKKGKTFIRDLSKKEKNLCLS